MEALIKGIKVLKDEGSLTTEEVQKHIGLKGNLLLIDIQEGNIPSNGINGLQVTDLLIFIKGVYTSLNSKFPCQENNKTIYHLNKAILHQDLRTKDK